MNLFKIPQNYIKFCGKSTYTWINNVYSKIYDFLLFENQSNFEQSRNLSLPQYSLDSDIFYIGLQRNKEIRELFRDKKGAKELIKSMTITEVYLPFFASKESNDKGSIYQLENELSCVLKVFLEKQIEILGNGTRLVYGSIFIGNLVSIYIMRKKNEENNFYLQPLNTFNLSIIDDLLKLQRLLSSIQKFGKEILIEIQNLLTKLEDLKKRKREEN